MRLFTTFLITNNSVTSISSALKRITTNSKKDFLVEATKQDYCHRQFLQPKLKKPIIMWYKAQINGEKNAQVGWDLNPHPTEYQSRILHYRPYL